MHSEYCSYIPSEPSAAVVWNDGLFPVVREHLEHAWEDDASATYPVAIFRETSDSAAGEGLDLVPTEKRLAAIITLDSKTDVAAGDLRLTNLETGDQTIYHVRYLFDITGEYVRTDITEVQVIFNTFTPQQATVSA